MSGRRRRSMSEINVVPYIDVMLVLLVIFMITTPLLSQGVKIELPQAKAETISKEQQEPIIVSVDAQGLFFLNISNEPDKPIAASLMAARVAAAMKLSEQSGQKRLVLVKGDKGVNYGAVVTAMVILQQAGVEKVGLMTETPENKA
jgi:biopolymer transport protein TolR